jgi:hypothetical protein
MLITASSMQEYFREAICAAQEKTGVALTDLAESYLINLLDAFARAENVYAGTEPGERPALAILMARAEEAEPEERVRIYRHMGDSSLYLTGFFAESVESSMVSRDYYVTMGETAYRHVAGLVRPTAASSSALFCELSDRFAELVQLLGEVSLFGLTDQAEKTPPDDLQVYELLERYRKTGRQDVLDALEKLGVALRPGLKDEDDGVIH